MAAWHVLGAGAIGGLWASHLSLAGYPVTLVLKSPESIDTFRRTPLCLQDGERIAYPEVGVTLAAEAGLIDRLLVSTKSFDALDALQSVSRFLSPRCLILLIQNGIGVQQEVAARFPGAAVLAGVTTDGAYRSGPFHVIRAGKGFTRIGAVTALGAPDIDMLINLCTRIELDALWVDDVWPALWHKLAINCCINAPTALRQCRNGGLLEMPFERERIIGLVAEIQQVMKAAGLGFSFPDLYDDVCKVIVATAQNYSSMCQDVSNGRKTEIEHINGFIVAEGKRLGVATPLNLGLVDAIGNLTCD